MLWGVERGPLLWRENWYRSAFRGFLIFESKHKMCDFSGRICKLMHMLILMLIVKHSSAGNAGEQRRERFYILHSSKIEAAELALRSAGDKTGEASPRTFLFND